MKKSSYVLGLLMAGLMVVSGTGKSFADDDVKISGFGEVLLPLSDDAHDNLGRDSEGALANDTELKFSVNAEVDLEKKVGAVSVRLDLDIPTRAGITASDHIEQMRFDWAPDGAPVGLTLTGGFFNSPIGLEGQDPTDLVTVTNGQLFGLVPSNLAGLQLSGGEGPFSGSILFVNDTNGGDEDNGFGITAAFAPMPILNVSVGYLTSEADEDTTLTRTTNANAIAGNGDFIDVIVSGEMPTGEINLSYALEFLTDDFNTGYGITLHAQHGPHGATLRYDSVDVDKGAPVFSGKNPTNTSLTLADTTPTTITVSVSHELEENLKAQLEWKTTDLDNNALPDDSTDAFILQFIATF